MRKVSYLVNIKNKIWGALKIQLSLVLEGGEQWFFSQDSSIRFKCPNSASLTFWPFSPFPESDPWSQSYQGFSQQFVCYCSFNRLLLLAMLIWQTLISLTKNEPTGKSPNQSRHFASKDLPDLCQNITELLQLTPLPLLQRILKCFTHVWRRIPVMLCPFKKHFRSLQNPHGIHPLLFTYRKDNTLSKYFYNGPNNSQLPFLLWQNLRWTFSGVC